MSKEYYVELNDENSSKLKIPSDKEKIRKHKPRLTKKDKNKIKWWFIILGIVLIYLFYDLILSAILDLLKSNPTIYKYYLGIEYEISNNTLKGLFFVAIFGSVFFLALPSEALFIYFLDSTTYPSLFVIIIMLLGNATGLTFNYFFGRILGERVIERMFKKNFEKYRERIDRYGGVVLFLGNIFPGPVEALTVFYGSFKFGYGRYIYLCLMGRIIKYTILFLLYVFYWDQLIIAYDDIVEGSFNFFKGLF